MRRYEINSLGDNSEVCEDKRLKIMGVEFVYLVLFGIVVAFAGWIGENAFKLAVSGKFDSRFHVLPFISPYILIPFAFHIALGKADDLRLFGKKIFREQTKKSIILSNIFSFLIICTFVFLGEFAVGNAWEYLFGVKLWNYNKLPLHLTQYTSIVSTLGFGTAVYLIFKFLYSPVLNLLRKRVSYKGAKWICLILGTLIFIDFVRLMLCMIILGEAPNLWAYNNGQFTWLP